MLLFSHSKSSENLIILFILFYFFPRKIFNVFFALFFSFMCVCVCVYVCRHQKGVFFFINLASTLMMPIIDYSILFYFILFIMKKIVARSGFIPHFSFASFQSYLETVAYILKATLSTLNPPPPSA